MEQAVRKPTPGPSAASGSSPLVAGPAPADTPGPAAPIDEPLRKDHPDFPDAVTMEEEMGFAVHASAYDYGRRERGYDFLDQWKLLSTSIIVLAAFFPAVMAWDSLDIETREKLLSWAPNAQATLANRFLSCSIWEGWLWRLLVDRVFLNHDDELWQGYGVLSTQFAAFANRPLDRWDVSDLKIGCGYDSWSPDALPIYYVRKHDREWNALTARLFQLATRHQFRFPAGYLSGLVEKELGRYFLPKDQQHGDLAVALADFDETALSADHNFHICPQRIRFSFTHLETGKAFGFPYRYLNPNPSKPPKDSNCVMLAHVAQSVNNNHYIGHPVDHVVRPYLWAESRDIDSRITDYMCWSELPMRVVINEDRVLEEIFGKQDGAEQPDQPEGEAQVMPADGVELDDKDTVEQQQDMAHHLAKPAQDQLVEAPVPGKEH